MQLRHQPSTAWLRSCPKLPRTRTEGTGCRRCFGLWNRALARANINTHREANAGGREVSHAAITETSACVQYISSSRRRGAADVAGQIASQGVRLAPNLQIDVLQGQQCI